MLMVSSMNLFSKCPSCQDTGCFGWHSFSFELIFAKDSKEHHILKCQGAQHGQPFDIMTKCCHLESSRSRTRQLRLKKQTPVLNPFISLCWVACIAFLSYVQVRCACED